jgi:hypothetical protein
MPGLDEPDRLLPGFRPVTVVSRMLARLHGWRPPSAPVVSAHRLDTGNLGDRMSSPTLYFDFLRAVPRFDLLQVPRRVARDASVIIVGGGGLLDNDYFGDAWADLLGATSAEVIAWGLGHNRHGGSAARYPEFLQRFSLAGLRDDAAGFGQAFDWVPCASCMHPAFDAAETVTTEVVCYAHASHPLRVEGVPTITNAERDFARVIRVLASADTVLTNTYHGMYWSTLLGRKVVVFPYSSKFYGFRYPVAMAEPRDWQSARRRAVRATAALAECRAANVAFAAKVQRRLAASTA